MGFSKMEEGLNGKAHLFKSMFFVVKRANFK